LTPFTTRPELAGTFGAVASTHWIATAVGMKMLEAGGNAFDAATATGFVMQIVEPHLSGPAGDAPILLARRDDDEPTVICGQGGAPARATPEAFAGLGLDLIPGTGSLAPCVPGAFGAWLTLLRDWGSLPLRAVLEPAIGYAVDGHPIHFNTVDTITAVQSLFRGEWTTSADVFLPGGDPPTPGTLFRNPVLGALYSDIVHHAEAASGDREGQIEAALRYWYEGPVALEIERFLAAADVYDVSGRRHRGLLAAGDMAGWRPPIERAASVCYRDHQVFKCGAWSQGPMLLQALTILRNQDAAALDDVGPDWVHLVAETLKLVLADRDAWYGDDPRVPIEGLLGDDYARRRGALISDQASLTLRPGSPGGIAPVLPPIRPPPAAGAPGHANGGGEPTFADVAAASARRDAGGVRGDTCHVDVVDRWGNMVSATPSGGWLQSNPIIPRLGFALGTRLQMFLLQSGHANTLAPGKRPRTTLTPSLVYRGGRPYLAFGTPGGDQQDQWSLQFLLRHIDHGHDLQRTIDAPAFHTEHLIASFWPREFQPGVLAVEDRFSKATTDELGRRGHVVKRGGPWSEGRLSACARDGSQLRAGANPRGMQGYAIAR
jgi:gamma-glutamyltranspeptidase/glutathione hydrolase